MAAIDLIFSRMAVFIVFWVIWFSLNGRLYAEAQSSTESPATTSTSEPEPTTQTPTAEPRPVNLIFINDEKNKIANKSVASALKALKEMSPNLVGKVTTITVDGADPKDDLERICETWDAAIKGSPQEVPDVVLDTTRSGYAAETVSAFTAALGIPTLTGQFGQENDMKNWRNLDADQYKYLVQVMPPTDIIPEGVRTLAYQMNISNAGVIFDEEFTMDHKYKSLLLNVQTRHILVPMKKTSDEIRKTLRQLRELDIVNYFILGNENTVRTVLDIGQSINYTDHRYAWYVLTQDEFEPRCECKNLTIIIFKPVMTPEAQQRILELTNRASLTKPILTSAFYFDLTRLAVTAMNNLIVEGAWPSNPKHITCEAFDGENTPVREINYYKELVAVSSASDFKPTFSSISWKNRNGRNAAKFDMRAKMVTIVGGNPISSEDLGIWPAGLDEYFKVKNDGLVRNHSAIASYRIVTVVKAPFVMYNPETKVWSGYCIDLINDVANLLNFTYELRIVEDGQFGTIDEKGRWNGMIRALQDKKADIALGALSVMAERENVVDFTVPYYDLVGISILMQKPKSETSLFKFLTVLENDVWLCILGSYFFTSILLWIFDRWSPYSYQNNREKFKDDDEKREFTLRESLWFSMTSLTPQGGGEAPKNLSGRLVAATWWLFGFIIIASYTANLAAFLTVSRLETPVESLDDLAKQYKVQYAPIFGSEAWTYFKRMSDIESRFYDIWRDMSLNDSMTDTERAKLAVWDYPVSDKFTKMFQAMTEAGFPSNMEAALTRVRHMDPNVTNDFAFIGDATDIKYLVMTNCDLLNVGSEFSRKPYAMAVQQGSPLKDVINNALLQLLNARKLEKLKSRWWDRNPAKVTCEKEEEQSEGISIANIGGVFIVIFVGIILACITLAFEYYWYRYRPAKKREARRLRKLKAEAQAVSPIKFTLKPAKVGFENNQIRSRF